MEKMFPTIEETWHLNRIFYQTIKYHPDERLKYTEDVIRVIGEIRYALDKGYPPLEAVAGRCPSCGNKSVRAAESGSQSFGGHMSNRYFAHECEICGFVFARNHKKLKDSLGTDLL